MTMYTSHPQSWACLCLVSTKNVDSPVLSWKYTIHGLKVLSNLKIEKGAVCKICNIGFYWYIFAMLCKWELSTLHQCCSQEKTQGPHTLIIVKKISLHTIHVSHYKLFCVILVIFGNIFYYRADLFRMKITNF